jgi:hypothetical protein
MVAEPLAMAACIIELNHLTQAQAQQQAQQARKLQRNRILG